MRFPGVLRPARAFVSGEKGLGVYLALEPREEGGRRRPGGRPALRVQRVRRCPGT